MKWSVLFFLLLLSHAEAAQEDLQQKIQSINEEIVEVEAMVASEKNAKIYQAFLEELRDEKERYEKLSQQNFQSKDTYSNDPSITKTIPKAMLKKTDADIEHTNELVPIQKRYDVLLRSLSNSRDILIKLKALKNKSKATENFIAAEEERLEKLEKLKIDYEIQLSEIEENELVEFKKSGLRVGASLDFYYQYDFNRADNANPLPNRNYNRRSNDFTLNLIELNVLKSFKNLDFYADLDFGDFAEQNSSHNSDPNTHHIGQAFLRYKLPDFEGVTVTAGKFYSHVGLEVAKSIDNRNYSRPYSFTRGIPFWHEGVSIYKSGLGPFGVGLYLYDRTDVALENNTGKAYGAQLSFIQDKITSYFNFISGAETADEGNMRTIYEYNLVWTKDRSLNLAFDVTYGQEKNATTDLKDSRWLGLVGYIDYNVYKKDNLCLRVENFRDLTSENADSNMFTGTNPDITGTANIMSYTLTNRYNLKNGSEVRAEWRSDKSTEKIYPRKNGKFSDEQNTISVAWLYSI